ncbi:MAG: ribosome-associated translation inhibitor RaiA [Thermoleophilia bacterium]|nr:ribosome-associated translation inhibitor RaiA [Thermoleophilia bacterium]
MQLQVKGKNLQVTDALFEHAERKLGKLSRILPPWDDATRVELELSVENTKSHGQDQVAEVTVRTKGPVLRVRERGKDMYNAIDQASHKLERQAARYRDRRKRRRGGRPPAPPASEQVVPAPVDQGPVIVKSKRFPMEPMSAEDAALQLDLLNHDFYVFRNDDDDTINVIYRRRDGNYGLISPDS